MDPVSRLRPRPAPRFRTAKVWSLSIAGALAIVVGIPGTLVVGLGGLEEGGCPSGWSGELAPMLETEEPSAPPPLRGNTPPRADLPAADRDPATSAPPAGD